jgi:hypothetical protein
MKVLKMNKIIQIIFIIIIFFSFYKSNAKNLFPVVKDGYVAYIDTSGKVVINDNFETDYEIYYINFEGKEYPSINFPQYAYFSEGKASFKKSWGFWFIKFGDEFGVVDSLGNIIIKPQDKVIWKYKNNFAKIAIPLKSLDYTYDEQFTFLNPKGEYAFIEKINSKEDLKTIPSSIIIEKNGENYKILTFKYASDFNDGWATILYNDKFNYINTQGKLFSEKGFNDVQTFSEGKAVVKLDSNWYILDSTGQVIYPKKSEKDNSYVHNSRIKYIWNFHNGVARYTDGEVMSFLNADGKIASCSLYKQANDFSEGFATIQLANGEYNFTDLNGKLLSKENFDGAGNFNSGLARVLIDEKWGFIDKAANLVIKNQFDFAQDFNDGFAYVWKDKTLMIININGKVIWEYNILNGKIE